MDININNFQKQTRYSRTIALMFAFAALLFSGCENEQQKNAQTDEVNNFSNENVNKKFKGYINDLSQAGTEFIIIADSIEWLSGEKAKKIYTQDNKAETFENGIYLRNINKDSISIILSPDAVITMQTFSHNPDGGFNFNERISVTQFVKLIEENESYSFTPFQFDVIAGKIKRIEEIYLP